MTTQVYKHIENGRAVYTHGERIIRKSGRDYKFALLGLAKVSLGSSGDADDYFCIALGNKPSNMVSTNKCMYGHMELMVVEITNI